MHVASAIVSTKAYQSHIEVKGIAPLCKPQPKEDVSVASGVDHPQHKVSRAVRHRFYGNASLTERHGCGHIQLSPAECGKGGHFRGPKEYWRLVPEGSCLYFQSAVAEQTTLLSLRVWVLHPDFAVFACCHTSESTGEDFIGCLPVPAFVATSSRSWRYGVQSYLTTDVECMLHSFIPRCHLAL